MSYKSTSTKIMMNGNRLRSKNTKQQIREETRLAMIFRPKQKTVVKTSIKDTKLQHGLSANSNWNDVFGEVGRSNKI